MSYTPTEWQAGDIVTATKLNNIEQGIVGVSSNSWEFIKEETFTHAEEADKTIDTDADGNSFELTDIILRFDLPADQTANIGDFGRVKAYANDTNVADVLVNTMTVAAGGSARCATAFFLQKNGLLLKFTQASQLHGSGGYIQMMSNSNTLANESVVTPIVLMPVTVGFTSLVIRKVTGKCHYILYGKRK